MSAKEEFGSFSADLWEDGEYVIFCKKGPIGGTMPRHKAEWLAEWLNNYILDKKGPSN